MGVHPVPKGYHNVTPYLVVEGASRLIEFLKEAFNGVEKERHAAPNGGIMHAEVRIGDSIVMMGDAAREHPPMPSCLYLYVQDVDATYLAALAAGGTSLSEPTNQFYGDRMAAIQDPSGNKWWIATRVEDVSEEELRERMQAMKQKG